MENQYVGPAMQQVPLGWFSDAASIAAKAKPGGIDITIELTENGFEIEGQQGGKIARRVVSIMDLAMEEVDNPFPDYIGQVVTELRG